MLPKVCWIKKIFKVVNLIFIFFSLKIPLELDVDYILFFLSLYYNVFSLVLLINWNQK